MISDGVIILSSRHDFVIFQEHDQSPVNITEYGFTKKVQTCFNARFKVFIFKKCESVHFHNTLSLSGATVLPQRKPL